MAFARCGAAAALEWSLPLLPAEAEVVGSDLTAARREGRLVLFDAAGPIAECRQEDELGVRPAAALAAELGPASVTALATALGGFTERPFIAITPGSRPA